jgi:hypothetical protein
MSAATSASAWLTMVEIWPLSGHNLLVGWAGGGRERERWRWGLRSPARQAATVAIEETEADARATASRFGGWDPPPELVDVHDDLTATAAELVEVLSEVRVAAHDGRWETLPEVARRLGPLADRLSGQLTTLREGLGTLSAIGGFIDIGDLVADALVGARFGLGLAWVTMMSRLLRGDVCADHGKDPPAGVRPNPVPARPRIRAGRAGRGRSP